MNAYTQQYQQNSILTASPEQILILLYDGAIRFTRQAMMGIESDNSAQKYEGVRRAMAIIAEFANTLDHNVGGEIAADLDALYAYMNKELTQANLNNDIEKLKVVEGLLVDLRQTWVEAIEVARNEATVPASQPAKAPQPAQGLPENYKPLSAAG
ncbi:MAG: flagellar export chaperone FliS [Deltaproteobacteria bacterium]|nr:flagellar export chaperone FliS [Deltaproteobacteria bacterium]